MAVFGFPVFESREEFEHIAQGTSILVPAINHPFVLLRIFCPLGLLHESRRVFKKTSQLLGFFMPKAD